MILHEYAILPFYIGQELSEHAQEQAKLLGWPCSDTPGTADHLAYRLPGPVKIPDGTEYQVDLVFIDTSACFLLHYIESQPAQSEYDMAKSILIGRNRLNNHLLSKEGNSLLTKLLGNLGMMGWRQIEASYVFNFYVLEMDSSPTQNSDNMLKIISDRSAVGVNNEMTAQEINQLDFDSMELTRLQELNNIDPHPHTTIYATWSAVVAGTRGDKENVNATKRMLVEMELQLQSVWNHCNQLNISARAFLDGEATDFDQEGFLIAATRFLQTHKQRISPSSTSTTREVNVLSHLVATSRLDKEIGTLEGLLLVIERTVERNREVRRQEHNYRRELGQDGITIGLVVLAAIGATQVISNISSWEGWAQRWWEPIAWIMMGGLSYRWTVRRTKQSRRK